ncbi:MAG TPA: alpha-hydroxy-acid oxidizing protein [Polyangiaceae bacterium]|nr:alpha-hydroxy-acid oxidizing protein [Polyangiaceae bacterium]
MADISRRKDDHLDLATSGDVAFKQTTTLFENVRLVHDALPELAFGEIDTSLELLGKRLRAPILIAGMTGGSDRAERINKELAAIAEERGYAFGLGSQRAMHKHPERSHTYAVRDVRPARWYSVTWGSCRPARCRAPKCWRWWQPPVPTRCAST